METVKITIQHVNADGVVLSTLPLEYPSLGNTLANALQFDLVDGIEGVARKYAVAKALAGLESAPLDELFLLEHGIDAVLKALGR